ncbi:PIG-L family deacetylase [Sinirhodobacter populi]|uniref:PIG-L family deacetylase n=1 Tax=Paenirhodobacter populi TaxID=2306993 RepID=A0A443KCS7_9RHOB|nr:PIG-L deacetylase family protein [Sinirhodobacter populi]RWR30649.1 PIG-L family deacetylase [Sinirhodobacter populi]
MISAFLRHAGRAPLVAADEIAGGDNVLLLAPHPDDETLGCGQLIAALTRMGVTVQVIVVTDGGASHPRSRLWPRERLAALRAAEVREAVALIGGGQAPPPVLLGYPDLAAPDDPAARAEAVARIWASRPGNCRAVLSTWEGNPHPDHQRVAKIARLLCAQSPGLSHWAYPVWGRFEQAVPQGRMVRFDDPLLHALKARALAAHKSQMTDLVPDDPAGFVMPADQQRHFLTYPEIFLHV